jgi:hypothetical protein
MPTTIPEQNKKPGVCYAFTDAGVELPVIDITHPAFRSEVNPADLASIMEESLHSLEDWTKLPEFLRHFLSSKSILMAGSARAEESSLDGMTTYLFKLGPENLGHSYANMLDRKSVKLIQGVALRMRLRTIAQLLADGLQPELGRSGNAPVALVNIGGGTASDDLNALLLLRRDHPELLPGRTISIHVFDLDSTGPRFGQKSLAALQASHAPLHDLTIRFEHIPYKWSDPALLQQKLLNLKTDAPIMAGSSEGGLFEYANDEEIIANLKTLLECTPGNFFFVGSMWRNEPIHQKFKSLSKMALRLFDLDRFQTVIRAAGWELEQTVPDNPIFHIVRLRKQ